MGLRALPARLARTRRRRRPADGARPSLLAPSFRFEEVQGGTRILTETRVDTTDPLAHRCFAAYWQFIRVGSAAIRRDWLRAIKRRAERSSAATAAPTR